MSLANLAYPPAANDALPTAVSIFADRAHVRDQLREDGEAAGFRIARVSEVADLLEGEALPLGEIVLLDCPAITGARLAALARLDLRAAHSGAHLIVSTSAAALDDVFACLDQSNPEILVDPSRADRVIALGRALARAPDSRVRDLSEEDRLMLLRLTEQVGQIAQRLDRLASHGYPSPSPEAPGGDSATRFVSPGSRYRGADQPLPDPDWCGASFANASFARGSSTAIFSPIRPGTSCLTSPPPRRSGRGFPSLRCASPRAYPRRPRCAGFRKWLRLACSSAARTNWTAAAPSSP